MQTESRGLLWWNIPSEVGREISSGGQFTCGGEKGSSHVQANAQCGRWGNTSACLGKAGW